LWRNVEGQRLERVKLPEVSWQRGWGIAAIDYDNDGWLDLVAAGESASGGELRLLRNLGTAGWADVTKDVHLDAVKLIEPRAIAVADIASDGNPDLIVTQEGGPPLLLRSEGANQHTWMTIGLKASMTTRAASARKWNCMPARFIKVEVAGASGYLGQNDPSILAGLNTEKNAEVVRLLWPTGVPQDEINLAAKKEQNIAELDRRGSSCPVLFSWNGREYEFIADMIGPGVVGHWVAPGERDVPDPDEYLKVAARSVPPAEWAPQLPFHEPMEETVYLDKVRLLAIDHPADYDVYPNERFVSAPPFPEFRVIASDSQHSHAPAGAWDDLGNNVLPLISKHDRKYVSSFEGLPFAGFAKLHYLELDLGAWDANKPLRLILDGLHRLFHCDLDVFRRSGRHQSDRALRRSPRCARQMDSRCR